MMARLLGNIGLPSRPPIGKPCHFIRVSIFAERPPPCLQKSFIDGPNAVYNFGPPPLIDLVI